MDFHAITDQHLDIAAARQDLDAALKPLLDVLDPTNSEDLGGEAGHWFCRYVVYTAPMDNGETSGHMPDVWNHIEQPRRRAYLAEFVDHLRDCDA